MPTWKNAKHGQQWINTLRDYAFPKIGRMPLDSIGQPEVMMCLSPIWTGKHETARRLAQRIKTVLDVANAFQNPPFLEDVQMQLRSGWSPNC